MLKGHPEGLYVAFFANMGERFDFYTMMAILVLFLQAKYGLVAKLLGDIYSWFYFAILALALVGGIVADATKEIYGDHVHGPGHYVSRLYFYGGSRSAVKRQCDRVSTITRNEDSQPRNQKQFLSRIYR